ncbi:hypothetical protein [Pyrobaculum aerophilum]|uniref:hypothetical protein n=1 Tax=Pyrobaculum aerophilum TaxID=13773 RepID=UPI002FD8DBA9
MTLQSPLRMEIAASRGRRTPMAEGASVRLAAYFEKDALEKVSFIEASERDAVSLNAVAERAERKCRSPPRKAIQTELPLKFPPEIPCRDIVKKLASPYQDPS